MQLLSSWCYNGNGGGGGGGEMGLIQYYFASELFGPVLVVT